MTPVDQTAFYSEEEGTRGNCCQAAVASILNLPLSEVPNFIDAGAGFWTAFYAFFEGRGLRARNYGGMSKAPLNEYFLASGPAERGVHHMVVMYNGELAHDPHPSRAGLLSVDHIHIIRENFGG